MKRLLAPIFFTAALLLIAVEPADAHIVASRLGDFYAGALHPLTDLQDLILWTALGLLAGSLGATRGRWLVLVLPFGLVSGLALGMAFGADRVSPLASSGMMLALGLLLAAGLRINVVALCAIALVLALMRGVVNAGGVSPDTNRLLFAAGLAGAGYVMITLIMAVTLVFCEPTSAAWRRIAIRVCGSWIAAIGLMLGAFTLTS
jgi:urease accessory protein